MAAQGVHEAERSVSVLRRAAVAVLAAAVGVLGLWAVPSARAAGTWWNTTWGFRVPVSVTANGTARTDKAVDATIDYAALVGAGSGFSSDSLRVLEVDGGGNAIGQPLPAQYDAVTGKTTWIMSGSTAANATRTFHVYFDRLNSGIGAQGVANQVSVSDSFDAGQDAFRVATAKGTWYLQKQGASFSSLIDGAGANWISYNAAAGAAGQYRGIPNYPFPEGYFHPGNSNSSSRVVSAGPLKVVLESTSNNNAFSYTSEIYPDHVTSTVTKADPQTPYWWLYEGTPGGISASNQFSSFVVGRSNGQTSTGADVWTGDLGPEEWAYFGVPANGRSLFLAHHEDDALTDSYWPLYDAAGSMTVFGFGRDGASDYLSGTNTFTMGLIDTTDAAAAASLIRSAYKPLGATVGAVEQRSGTDTTASTTTTAPTTTTTAPTTTTTAPTTGTTTLPASGPSGYFSLASPARLIDTRNPFAPLVAPTARALQVVGVGGVPTGASAAVLNVTVVGGDTSSHLTVWPGGGGRPTASNINYTSGSVTPNLVTVAIGGNGKIEVGNGAGTTHVVVDLLGYYVPLSGGGFHPFSPTRLLDTRDTAAPVGPGATRTLSVAGIAGIDPGSVRAVALNVTATAATAEGFVSVAPSITARPQTSNLNVATSPFTVANGVLTAVTGTGSFDLYNANGSVHLVVDLVGWFDNGTSIFGNGLGFHAVTPERVLDTRLGANVPVSAGVSRSVAVGGGSFAVPSWAGAVALNVTSVAAADSGFVKVYPTGEQAPNASTMNVTGGVTRANATLSKVGTGSSVNVLPQPSTHLVVDVAGWFG